MTQSFSQPSIFPTYPSSEENLYSAIKFTNGYFANDCPDNNLDGFGGNSRSFGSFNLESEKSRDHGIDKGTNKDNDILGRLPADPFGMDIRSTVTALKGWIQDFDKDFGKECYGLNINEAEKKIGDHRLFTGQNWVWNGAWRLKPEANNAKYEDVKFDEIVVDNGLCDDGFASMRLKPEANDLKFDERSIPFDRFSDFMVDSGLCDAGFVVEEFLSFGDTPNWVVRDRAEGIQDGSGVYFDGEGGAPHDAMFFALGYLGVRDLLLVERVCKSLRHAVRSDPLLWRSIHINQPLSERITDDALVQITSRAQGTLQCLSLVECIRITDNGLKLVLESNPRMTKLSVPGCVRLSVEGILFNLRASKSAGKPGIKHLRIGGLLNITDKQFEELKFLLGADNFMQMKAHKPQFYRGGQLYLSCEDDRTIDIETCPRCQKLGLVYDCPAESCQKKHHAAQLCRACTLCIARCINCGHCINDCDYEETFCLDLLCLDCWKQLLKREERPEEKGVSSSKCTILRWETKYQFCRYSICLWLVAYGLELAQFFCPGIKLKNWGAAAIDCTLRCHQAVESCVTLKCMQPMKAGGNALVAEL